MEGRVRALCTQLATTVPGQRWRAMDLPRGGLGRAVLAAAASAALRARRPAARVSARKRGPLRPRGPGEAFRRLVTLKSVVHRRLRSVANLRLSPLKRPDQITLLTSQRLVYRAPVQPRAASHPAARGPGVRARGLTLRPRPRPPCTAPPCLSSAMESPRAGVRTVLRGAPTGPATLETRARAPTAKLTVTL